ncbi:MICOS complex subunit MIC13 homolog QIL1 [Macrosteles quadrilineatus]|uniref:MICOS complex subunit MIC13 homolog QIL1 n=1 Tax=Macrosteles quadrilineatus TaxID=74068 RepID=UPI0023E0DD67|nr:MICOS complex subunit MIC13 homolog QIL1 [Macrosteles quadrilineatus]
MAILGKILRSGTKFGIVGGACYYSVQSGLWADTTQTEQLYKELYKSAAPYMKHTVIEVPELPKFSDFTKVICKKWNDSVIASTDFLMHLPSHLSNFASTSFEKVNELVSDPKPPTAQ